MARTIIRCKRCGHKLTSLLSREREYGPTCWEKEGRFVTQVQVSSRGEMEALRKEVNALKALVATLQHSPQIPMPSQLEVSNGQAQERSPIPIMAGGWEVSELETNPLFMKMQMVCANA